MDGLNMRILGELSIAYPPISEQLEILGVVKKHVEAFDDLLKRVAQAVDLLIERRTALISAAVTGKIDVRNWQSPTEPQADKDTP
jgi:type I restriction enzyme S subunit